MRKLFHRLLQCLAVVVLISSWVGADQPAPAAPRALTVSAATVDGNEESSARTANVFVQRIGLGRNYQAKRAADCSWDAVPKGVAAENHVNIVQLKFGNRLELLALMPETGKSGVALAARAPALFQDRPFFPLTASPGDSQWPDNAPADLVAQFADAMERRSESRGVFQLILESWKQEERAEVVDLTMGDSAAQAFSTKDAGMTRILPLAVAAMGAQDFRASTRPQDSVITLNLKMGEAECDVRAALSQGGRKIHELERFGIQYEKLYDSLRALFLNLIEWQGAVADFHNPGRAGFQPLAVAATDNQDPNALERTAVLLAGMDNEGFLAFEPATGKRAWKKDFGERGSGVARNGQMFLCGGSRLTKISAVNGEPEFSAMTKNLKQMDVEGNLLADGLNRELRCLDKGQGGWTNTLPCSILAGPRFAEGGVAVGDAGGEFRCFSLEGRELWKVALPRSVRGGIHAAGGLFFAVDDRGVLYVVDRQGKLLWQAEIGDVMTGPPQVTGAGVVVGSKAGKLFLLDKSTGKVLKQYPFKSWLLGCRVVGSKIICLTYDQRLHLFDQASFAAEKALRFPFKFSSEIIPVKDFPRRRKPGELESAKVTGCLVSDVKGNVYVIPAAAGP